MLQMRRKKLKRVSQSEGFRVREHRCGNDDVNSPSYLADACLLLHRPQRERGGHTQAGERKRVNVPSHANTQCREGGSGRGRKVRREMTTSRLSCRVTWY